MTHVDEQPTYQEYPKMLTRPEREPVIVNSKGEQASYEAQGWSEPGASDPVGWRREVFGTIPGGYCPTEYPKWITPPAGGEPVLVADEDAEAALLGLVRPPRRA